MLCVYTLKKMFHKVEGRGGEGGEGERPKDKEWNTLIVHLSSREKFCNSMFFKLNLKDIMFVSCLTLASCGNDQIINCWARLHRCLKAHLHPSITSTFGGASRVSWFLRAHFSFCQFGSLWVVKFWRSFRGSGTQIHGCTLIRQQNCNWACCSGVS